VQVESIAACVKTAAEAAVQESQFIYDPETGLYYDYVSGQYYDAVSNNSERLEDIGQCLCDCAGMLTSN